MMGIIRRRAILLFSATCLFLILVYLLQQAFDLNFGVGTKPIGNGFSEARGKMGVGCISKYTNGCIEMFGKSSKANLQTVIDEIMRKFGG